MPTKSFTGWSPVCADVRRWGRFDRHRQQSPHSRLQVGGQGRTNQRGGESNPWNYLVILHPSVSSSTSNNNPLYTTLLLSFSTMRYLWIWKVSSFCKWDIARVKVSFVEIVSTQRARQHPRILRLPLLNHLKTRVSKPCNFGCKECFASSSIKVEEEYLKG